MQGPSDDSSTELLRSAMAAIDAGDVGALAAVLDEGPSLVRCDLGGCDPDLEGQTLLLYATRWPGGAANGARTVGQLLAAGADPNTRFRHDGETVLHWAASNPHDAGIVAALCAGGATVDALGGVIGGGTPLMNAVHFGFPDAADALIEADASVHNLPTAAGLGRLDLLQAWIGPQGEFDDDAFRTDPTEAVGELSEDARTGVIHGALSAAVFCGQYRAADWLLARGAAVNAIPAGADTTLLHQVAKRGSLWQAMFLVERGADVAMKTLEHGATTFEYAWAHGQFEVMTYLMDQAATYSPQVAAACGRLDAIVGAALDSPTMIVVLGATLGQRTAIGKPVHPRVLAGRLEIARYLVQLDPALGQAEFEGVPLVDAAAAAGAHEIAEVLRRTQ